MKLFEDVIAVHFCVDRDCEGFASELIDYGQHFVGTAIAQPVVDRAMVRLWFEHNGERPRFRCDGDS